VVAVAVPVSASVAVAQADMVPVAVAVVEAVEHALTTVWVTVNGSGKGVSTAEHVSHTSPHFREIGLGVGARLGAELCARVGDADGSDEGASVGAAVGGSVGAFEGTRLGLSVGPRVGLSVGPRVGLSVGPRVGAFEGAKVGAFEGAKVGAIVGPIEYCSSIVPVGLSVGAGSSGIQIGTVGCVRSIVLELLNHNQKRRGSEKNGCEKIFRSKKLDEARNGGATKPDVYIEIIRLTTFSR
jgi:hypothetical protein